MDEYLITGGGSGIGAALAVSLAAQNKKVTIVGRTEKTLLDIVQKDSEHITPMVCDITKESDCERLIHFFNNKPLTGLIHNAGMLGEITSIKTLNISQLRAVMALNIEAPMQLTQGLLSCLKGGRVLHISSGAAHHAFATWGAYCISKAAFFMLYQCFKLECEGVFFASVMPGIVDTPMQQNIRQSKAMPEDSSHFFNSLKKQNKLVSPQVVAQFLTWLLLAIDEQTFEEKEWDIYDVSHHCHWLKNDKVPFLS